MDPLIKDSLIKDPPLMLPDSLALEEVDDDPLLIKDPLALKDPLEDMDEVDPVISDGALVGRSPLLARTELLKNSPLGAFGAVESATLKDPPL